MITYIIVGILSAIGGIILGYLFIAYLFWRAWSRL